MRNITLNLYYRRGGRQHGENISRERGEFQVQHDGKTWVYETPKHAGKREIRSAITEAFIGPAAESKLSGRYPYYSVN